MFAHFLRKPWIAILTLVSFIPACTPVDDFKEYERPFRQTRNQIHQPPVTDTRQQLADSKKAELEAKQAEELKIKEQQKPDLPKETVKTITPDLPPPPPPVPPVVKPKNQPVAVSVPGKPGFVYSPFNNKIVDVKGIPSGTIVADPQYPPSEKMHFRVP